MKSKNYTPIGFLIEMLHISVKDMAKEIFVDPTTISKWKSSDRPLSSKCDSFEKVVEYILNQNSLQKRNILDNLFATLYGEVPYRTKDYLKSCLCKFLDNSVIPVEAKNLLAQSKGGLYSCLMSIYSGVEGRKTVMDMLLNEAEAMDKPSDIMFFDQHLFSWFIYDEQYTRQWHNRIKSLLEKGWNISMIITCTSLTSELNMFVSRNQTFNIYCNYHEYYFLSNVNISLLPTSYVIKDKNSVLGYNENKSMYSCFYKDKFSIQQACVYLKNLMSECIETFTPSNNKDRIYLVDKLISYESVDEPCYSIASKPSFINMSEELINDVLRTNNIYGDLKSAILKMYHTVRKSMSTTKKNTFFRHIIYPMQLKERIVYEKISYSEISTTLGKEIYVTNEQFREHLRNAAKFVTEHENYSIAFTSPMESLPTNNYYIRCVNKLYALCVDESVRFNPATSIVQSTFLMMDDIWCKKIHPQDKDKEIVTKALLEIANMK